MVNFERHNYIEFAAGALMEPRIYQTFDLFFVHRGVIELEIGGHRFRLPKGRAVLIYPQTVFRGWCRRAARVSSQHFSVNAAPRPGPTFGRLAGKENGYELAPRPFSEEDERDIHRALRMATIEQTPLIREMRTAQLVLVLSEWRPRAPAVRGGPRHAMEFRQLVAWLEANLDQPMTLDQMAARVRLSGSQFRQLFKDLLGSTPAQFFLNMRMDASKRLLVESDAGIKSVAQAAGFSDLPHFYRNFKRHTGQTPDQFRRTHS